MRDSLDPHSVSRWTELLINAETGQVGTAENQMSVTLARFTGLILRPASTGRWAHWPESDR